MNIPISSTQRSLSSIEEEAFDRLGRELYGELPSPLPSNNTHTANFGVSSTSMGYYRSPSPSLRLEEHRNCHSNAQQLELPLLLSAQPTTAFNTLSTPRTSDFQGVATRHVPHNISATTLLNQPPAFSQQSDHQSTLDPRLAQPSSFRNLHSNTSSLGISTTPVLPWSPSYSMIAPLASLQPSYSTFYEPSVQSSSELPENDNQQQPGGQRKSRKAPRAKRRQALAPYAANTPGASSSQTSRSTSASISTPASTPAPAADSDEVPAYLLLPKQLMPIICAYDGCTDQTVFVGLKAWCDHLKSAHRVPKGSDARGTCMFPGCTDKEVGSSFMRHITGHVGVKAQCRYCQEVLCLRKDAMNRHCKSKGHRRYRGVGVEECDEIMKPN